MKKILISILISSISLSALAGGVFNMPIPQPDFISNDWDGDGIINSLDDDDDGDGIKDVDDSTPFSGRPKSLIVDSFLCEFDNPGGTYYYLHPSSPNYHIILNGDILYLQTSGSHTSFSKLNPLIANGFKYWIGDVLRLPGLTGSASVYDLCYEKI